MPLEKRKTGLPLSKAQRIYSAILLAVAIVMIFISGYEFGSGQSIGGVFVPVILLAFPVFFLTFVFWRRRDFRRQRELEKEEERDRERKEFFDSLKLGQNSEGKKE
jgi:amino acid transporter